jgi:hypothetical protein
VVKPVITLREEQNGLLLMPPSLFIHVDTAPILDVHFVQSRVKVTGRVTCIESPCDPSLTITLTPQDQKAAKLTAVLEAAKSSEHQFAVSDVLPGRYEVTISNTNWCWKQASYRIEVRSEDIGDISFIQTGYLMPITSSHATSAELQRQGSQEAAQVIQLAAGASKHCIEHAGIDLIQFIVRYLTHTHTHTLSLTYSLTYSLSLSLSLSVSLTCI